MGSKRLEEWLQPEKLAEITGMARDGYTDAEIAKNMNVAYSTLRKWRDENQAISAALKMGKQVADYTVENALFKAACGYWTEEETIEEAPIEGTTRLVVARKKTVKKFVPPNPTAGIFWLKNRKADQWKDKREEKIETNDSGLKISIQNEITDYAN